MSLTLPYIAPSGIVLRESLLVALKNPFFDFNNPGRFLVITSDASKTDFQYLRTFQDFKDKNGITDDWCLKQAKEIFELLKNNDFIKKSTLRGKLQSISVTLPTALPKTSNPTILNRIANTITKIYSETIIFNKDDTLRLVKEIAQTLENPAVYTRYFYDDAWLNQIIEDSILQHIKRVYVDYYVDQQFKEYLSTLPLPTPTPITSSTSSTATIQPSVSLIPDSITSTTQTEISNTPSSQPIPLIGLFNPVRIPIPQPLAFK